MTGKQIVRALSAFAFVILLGSSLAIAGEIPQPSSAPQPQEMAPLPAALTRRRGRFAREETICLSGSPPPASAPAAPSSRSRSATLVAEGGPSASTPWMVGTAPAELQASGAARLSPGERRHPLQSPAMTGDSERYTLVTSGTALEEAARRWAESPVLGLDTEFVRTNDLLSSPGADPGVGRPVLLARRSPRGRGPHAPGRGLSCTSRLEGRCTRRARTWRSSTARSASCPSRSSTRQVAAALAGAGAFLSYQKLVAAYLGVELAKEETRTDWMARPLSAGPARLRGRGRGLPHPPL